MAVEILIIVFAVLHCDYAKSFTHNTYRIHVSAGYLRLSVLVAAPLAVPQSKLCGFVALPCLNNSESFSPLFDSRFEFTPMPLSLDDFVVSNDCKNFEPVPFEQMPRCDAKPPLCCMSMICANCRPEVQMCKNCKWLKSGHTYLNDEMDVEVQYE